MILVCSICGQPPLTRIVEAGVNDEGWRNVEKVPTHCPTPTCQYHDPDQIDGDWLVARQD